MKAALPLTAYKQNLNTRVLDTSTHTELQNLAKVRWKGRGEGREKLFEKFKNMCLKNTI